MIDKSDSTAGGCFILFFNFQRASGQQKGARGTPKILNSRRPRVWPVEGGFVKQGAVPGEKHHRFANHPADHNEVCQATSQEASQSKRLNKVRF